MRNNCSPSKNRKEKKSKMDYLYALFSITMVRAMICFEEVIASLKCRSGQVVLSSNHERL